MAEYLNERFDMSERNDAARRGQEFDLSADEQAAVTKAVLAILQRFDGPVLSFEGGQHRTREGRGDLAQNALATITEYIKGVAAKLGCGGCDECDTVRIELMQIGEFGEGALLMVRVFGGEAG